MAVLWQLGTGRAWKVEEMVNRVVSSGGSIRLVCLLLIALFRRCENICHKNERSIYSGKELGQSPGEMQVQWRGRGCC